MNFTLEHILKDKHKKHEHRSCFSPKWHWRGALNEIQFVWAWAWVMSVLAQNGSDFFTHGLDWHWHFRCSFSKKVSRQLKNKQNSRTVLTNQICDLAWVFDTVYDLFTKFNESLSWMGHQNFKYLWYRATWKKGLSLVPNEAKYDLKPVHPCDESGRKRQEFCHFVARWSFSSNGRDQFLSPHNKASEFPSLSSQVRTGLYTSYWPNNLFLTLI